MARRRFSVYQRGGSAMSNMSRLLIRNALKRRRSNQAGSGFKSMGRKVFKALKGKNIVKSNDCKKQSFALGY